MFADFDIRLELTGVSEWTPEPGATLEEKRRGLAGGQSDGNWVLLGFTASDAGAAEPGQVVPFDTRVLVFDFPEKSETENAANLAHELGHVFGAWHSSDEKSIMHLPPGPHFDRDALECIRLTRSMDTRRGISGLGPETVDGVTKLWSASKADTATSPIFQFYASSGYELMSLGYVRPALEPLSRATALAPGDTRTHYALAAAYMALRDYHSAANELRKLAEITPASAPALNRLATALAQSRPAEDAVATLRKTTGSGPEDGSLHANMGIALARIAGHLDEGIEELRQAARINPNDEGAKMALDAALAAKGRGRN